MDWQPSYSVGVPLIDEQHKELFRRIGRLSDALLKGDRSEVGSMLDFLGTYVIEHFSTEEREMKATDYPLYDAHKAAHDKFVADWVKLKQEFDAGGATPWLTLRINGAVLTWLKEHILGMDQVVGRHLAAHGRAVARTRR